MLSALAMQRAAAAIAGLAALGAVSAVCLWIAQRPVFNLQRVELRGDLQHVAAPSVRAALAGQMRGTFFTVDLERTRQLVERVPWVATASARRVWPNRLEIHVTEHRALGVWSDGRLLSERGELFVANPAEAEIDGPLPEFSGPPAAAAQAALRFRQLGDQLAPLGLKLVALDVSDRRSWAVQATSAEGEAVRIELGRDSDQMTLEERVEQLAAAYPIVVARLGAPPARIDARYPAGFAATPAKPR